MPLLRRTFLLSSLAVIPAATSAAKPEQNWPQFRGLGSTGIAEGFPTHTSWNVNATDKSSGLLWHTEIPSLGHASPILWKDRIYLATAVPKSGKPTLRIGTYGDVGPAKDDDEQRWLILCFDKKSGKKKWEQVIRTAKPATRRHEKASHANTTLVTDGKHLIGFFGADGLYCLDLKGKLLWQKDLGDFSTVWVYERRLARRLANRRAASTRFRRAAIGVWRRSTAKHVRPLRSRSQI